MVHDLKHVSHQLSGCLKMLCGDDSHFKCRARYLESEQIRYGSFVEFRLERLADFKNPNAVRFDEIGGPLEDLLLQLLDTHQLGIRPFSFEINEGGASVIVQIVETSKV